LLYLLGSQHSKNEFFGGDTSTWRHHVWQPQADQLPT